jgi:hypothetical protein
VVELCEPGRIRTIEGDSVKGNQDADRYRRVRSSWVPLVATGYH